MFSFKSEDEIKKDMLDRVSNTMDKSQNSFIHDAIAPTALEIVNLYMNLQHIQDSFDIEKLSGSELDTYIYQHSGLARKGATKATVIVEIEGDEGTPISEGDLVAAGEIAFAIQEYATIGSSGLVSVLAECVEYGDIGNVPAGTINYFPSSIAGAVSVTNPEPATGGDDEEGDNSFRDRYYTKIKAPAISGNKQHYENWAREVSGVGDARVIPIWNGPGTVKVIIIDSARRPASSTIVKEVADHIEEERPIGANVTVVSAIAKEINISVTVIKDESYTLSQVKTNIEKSIADYLKEISFKESFISFAQVGRTIIDAEGVLDYSNLKLNGSIINISLGFEEAPVLREVVLDE